MSPPRAAALPPDERRRAIVEAVVPLLLERGAEVTTREIAAAAGVAEGTLFRVFEDKHALLHAVASAVLDPERDRAALEALGPDLPLPELLEAVAEHLLRRSRETMTVLMALRGLHAQEGEPLRRGGPPPFLKASSAARLQVLTDLLTPHRDALRVSPARAALLLRALVSGSRSPWQEEDPLTPLEITAALLHGVAASTPEVR